MVAQDGVILKTLTKHTCSEAGATYALGLQLGYQPKHLHLATPYGFFTQND